MRLYAVWWCGVMLLPTVVLGGMWLLRRDLRKPNWVIPTQMAVSPAYRSQTANPVLPKGITMQLPPPGTLARDEHAFHYSNTDADRKRAGRELVNPFPPTHENIERGRLVYEAFCLVCHGISGEGDGPVVPKFPNPPNFHSIESKALSDGEMFHVITLGRNRMAGYASQLQWDDRWQVIHYIRVLREEK